MTPARAFPTTTDCLAGSGGTLPLTGSFVAVDVVTLEALAAPDLSFLFTYTRGAVGGFCRAQLEWWDPAAQVWFFDTSPTGGATVSGPTISTPVAITIAEGPAPADGSALSYEMTWRRRGGATKARLSVAEATATAGTPGTLTRLRAAYGGT